MGQISPQVAQEAALAGVEEDQRQPDTNTLRRPKPREWTVCVAGTKIPKRAAICLEFREPLINPVGFTRFR